MDRAKLQVRPPPCSRGPVKLSVLNVEGLPPDPYGRQLRRSLAPQRDACSSRWVEFDATRPGSERTSLYQAKFVKKFRTGVFQGG